ncbi:MAG: S-layer homology domain-containing protein, partial [Thermosynechococcaceae cyanobacterium]
MVHHSRQTATVLMGALLSSSLVAVVSTPAKAQSTQFSDVSFSYWARPFIEKLAEKNIIKGFPDGSFKPDEPVTRAQFAAIVRQAFNEDSIRRYTGFKDVPDNFWATPAITQAYTTGFMSGYPSNEFKPTQQIPKVQALVSLTSGLQLKSTGTVDQSLGRFQDASDLPDYAKPGVAAATETGLVVNYPNAKYLNPNQAATRADIAAFVYQALVNQKQLSPLAATDKTSAYSVTAA